MTLIPEEPIVGSFRSVVVDILYKYRLHYLIADLDKPEIVIKALYEEKNKATARYLEFPQELRWVEEMYRS